MRFFEQPFFNKTMKRIAKMLTIAVSVCNNPVIVGLNAVVGSVQSFVNSCSSQIVEIKPTNAPFTVQIPCGMSGDCDTNRWADLADNTIERYTNIKTEMFDHKAYIVPTGLCPFAGLGHVGPTCPQSGCRIWIPADKSQYTSVFLHELGHNWGLLHSLYGGTEYSDLSSAMGGCCDQRCFSAPEEYILNWTKPKKELHVARTSTVNLKGNEFAVTKDLTYFLQFRTNKAGIEYLNPMFANMVNVYTVSNKTVNLIAMLQKNQQIAINSGTVFVMDLTPESATIVYSPM
ncbi:hypothetical protein EBZ39_16760 [bacterium]|nr:hypothetical protein [bacterium]